MAREVIISGVTSAAMALATLIEFIFSALPLDAAPSRIFKIYFCSLAILDFPLLVLKSVC